MNQKHPTPLLERQLKAKLDDNLQQLETFVDILKQALIDQYQTQIAAANTLVSGGIVFDEVDPERDLGSDTELGIDTDREEPAVLVEEDDDGHRQTRVIDRKAVMQDLYGDVDEEDDTDVPDLFEDEADLADSAEDMLEGVAHRARDDYDRIIDEVAVPEAPQPPSRREGTVTLSQEEKVVLDIALKYGGPFTTNKLVAAVDRVSPIEIDSGRVKLALNKLAKAGVLERESVDGRMHYQDANSKVPLGKLIAAQKAAPSPVASKKKQLSPSRKRRR